jgi:hypothetical protein
MERIQIKSFFKVVVIIILFSTPLLVSSQANKNGSMPQFLFDEFTDCNVLMKNGQVQTPLLNYNTISEKMVFTRDNKYYDLTNPEMVDTVYIQNRKFVPVGKMFYEALFFGPVSLYVQHKGSLLPAGKAVGYGGTSQVASTNYISSIKLSDTQVNLPIPGDYEVKISTDYWIQKENNWFDFNNEKQFLKLFPDKEAKLKSFIKENRIKFNRQDDLIKLVKYCSSL